MRTTIKSKPDDERKRIFRRLFEIQCELKPFSDEGAQFVIQAIDEFLQKMLDNMND